MGGSTQKPKRLGERLIHDGLISENQLRSALAEQRRTGATLGEALVSMGFLHEDRLAEVLADVQGLPFVQLGDADPGPELLAAIGPEFARRYGVFPVERRGDVVRVAMARPTDILAIDAVKQHLWRHIEVVAASPRAVNSAISRCLESISNKHTDVLSESGPELLAAGGGDDAVGLTDKLLDWGLRNLATDIHVEPEEKLLRVRYRIDGILEQGENLPKNVGPAVLTRLKILSNLDITERRLPQDGRMKLVRGQNQVDMRVSIMPTNHGENAVIRVLDKSSVSLDLDDLGLKGSARTQLEAVVRQSNGMVLVSGPTGSGKSTTLYALLNAIDSLTRKVITIEDPIEYEQPLVRQSQVDTSIGYTFAEGLRTALRQDPDIILVGEVRDAETADTALKASLTGHLVLSSIHTNSAIGVVTRLLDLGIDRYLVASSLTCAVAQRLVRCVCRHCGAPRPATAAEAAVLGLPVQGLSVREGPGCDTCRGTGYAGRMAVYEVFLMDSTSARLIAEGGGEHELNGHARAQGWPRMVDDARDKVLAGKTTVAELVRLVPSLVDSSAGQAA